MWLKTKDTKSVFVKPETILDYNITSREVNTARGILTLHLDNGETITCKPHKTDYQEWLTMLKYTTQKIGAKVCN